MAVDDFRVQLRHRLEELVGVDGATHLMDRPPGGWSELVTNQTLEVTVAALRSELRSDMAELRSELRTEIAQLSASVDRRLRAQTWVTTSTLMVGLALAFSAGRFG
jgi:hypothetical protein